MHTYLCNLVLVRILAHARIAKRFASNGRYAWRGLRGLSGGPPGASRGGVRGANMPAARVTRSTPTALDAGVLN